MNELFFWGIFVIGDLSKRPVFLKTLRTLQWLLVALRINPTLPNWPANSRQVLAPGATPALLSLVPQPDYSLSSELKGDLPREVDPSDEV